MTRGTYYLTTPIYYVNANPHVGHAYTTIMTDIVARHHRQLGEDVFFLTGTDEHGAKVAQAAVAAGRSPKEHADQLSERFRALGAELDATKSFFIRTTDDAHKAEVQAEAIAQLEDQWGVRFMHVALVAEGGLLDVRYQVTDPDKAVYMFDEVENIPRVIASNGIELAMNDDPHTHDLEFGFSYFFLLRNVDDSVKPGDQVTIAVGDVELPFFEVEQ